jgi:hypothetical protein
MKVVKDSETGKKTEVIQPDCGQWTAFCAEVISGTTVQRVSFSGTKNHLVEQIHISEEPDLHRFVDGNRE